jgi:hypothetical protein
MNGLLLGYLIGTTAASMPFLLLISWLMQRLIFKRFSYTRRSPAIWGALMSLLTWTLLGGCSGTQRSGFDVAHALVYAIPGIALTAWSFWRSLATVDDPDPDMDHYRKTFE